MKSYLAEGHTDSASLAVQQIPASVIEQPLAKIVKGEVLLHQSDSVNAIALLQMLLAQKRKKTHIYSGQPPELLLMRPTVTFQKQLVC